MRFDKDADEGALTGTPPLAFGRAIQGFHSSGIANSHQPHKRLHDRSPLPLDLSSAPSGASLVTAGPSSAASSQQSNGKENQSAPSAKRNTHQRTASDGIGRRSLQHDQSSLNSSEGFGSPMIGKHVSAATSATSLRGSSIYKAQRESHELGRNTSQSTQRQGSHSRNTSASISRSGSLDKAKSKQANATSSPPSKHAHRIKSSAASSIDADVNRSVDLSAYSGTVTPRKADPRIPSALTAPLSPIAGSSPGESHRSTSVLNESLQSSVSQPYEKSLLAQVREAQVQEAKALEELVQLREQAGRRRAGEQAATALTKQARESLDAKHREALRRYRLLQQLLLDELIDHGPDSSGWLDARNGCERVLMPRPALRNNDLDVRFPGVGGTNAELSATMFERSRGASYNDNRTADDHTRVQGLLSSSQITQPSHFGDEGRRPIFHHRLPPVAPSGSTDDEVTAGSTRPAVPKRSSSRQKYHRATTGRVSNGPQTPALTPNMLSDDEDKVDDLFTPDLATVIAQGRQLERDREKWREQHRKSMERRHHSHRQRSKSTRADVGRPPMPTEQVQQEIMPGPSTKLKHSRSSPDLRQKQETATTIAAAAQDPSSPNVPRCFGRKTPVEHASAGQIHGRRLRSKSFENLSHFYHSAMAKAAPCMARSVSAKSVNPKDEKSHWPASDDRKRAQSLSRYEHEKQSQATRRAKGSVSERRLIEGEPYKVTRTMRDESTSPGLGPGPLIVRHPSWAPPPRQRKEDVSERVVEAERTSVDHYAAAISSPRPDIGAQGVSSEVTFVHAGRHATKRGYHRPTNSDELAAFLHGAPGKSRSRKPVPDFIQGNADDATASASLHQHNNDEWNMFDNVTSSNSLPVPLRRSRSRSDKAASLTSSVSPQPVPGGVGRASVGRDSDRFALDDLSEVQRLRLQSFDQPGNAFQTPPLLQFNRERQDYPFLQQESATESQSDKVNASRRSNEASTARPSFDDGASVHAREMWNTDNHREEDFTSLFFRRPKARLAEAEIDRTTRSAGLTVEEMSNANNATSLEEFLLSRQFVDGVRTSSRLSASNHSGDSVDETKEKDGRGHRTSSSTIEARRSVHSRTPSGSRTRDRYVSPTLNQDDVVRLGRVDSKRKPHLHVHQHTDADVKKQGTDLHKAVAYAHVDQADTPTLSVVGQASTTNDFLRPRHNSLTASIVLNPTSSTEDVGQSAEQDAGVDDDLNAVLRYITFASPSAPPSASHGLDEEMDDDDRSGGSAAEASNTFANGHAGLAPPLLLRHKDRSNNVGRNADRTSANTLASSVASMYDSSSQGHDQQQTDRRHGQGSAVSGTAHAGGDSIRGMVRSHVWPTPPPASPRR
jgi:hypothetical protein